MQRKSPDLSCICAIGEGLCGFGTNGKNEHVGNRNMLQINTTSAPGGIEKNFMIIVMIIAIDS